MQESKHIRYSLSVFLTELVAMDAPVVKKQTLEADLGDTDVIDAFLVHLSLNISCLQYDCAVMQ